MISKKMSPSSTKNWLSFLGLSLTVLFWANTVFSQSLNPNFDNSFLIQNQIQPNDYLCPNYESEFCNLIEIKKWPSEERLSIENEISKLQKNGLNFFLKKIREDGYTKILRATYGFGLSISMETPLKRETHQYAFTDANKKWIVILDFFFLRPLSKDPISNVTELSLVFLHELVHAFDSNNTISTDPNFLKLAGFETEGPWHSYVKISRQSQENAIEEVVKLNNQNEYEKAAFYDRTFAMKQGLPRIYSMKSPQEALADLTSYIYHDPNHKNYIHTNLIDYIDNKILNGARSASTFYD